MKNIDTCSLKIVSGPNAGMLTSALRHAYDDALTIKTVITAVSGKVKMKIDLDRVVGLCHEDGSGHKFIVDAYINGELERFYYNSASGTGHFLPLADDVKFKDCGLDIVDGPNADTLVSGLLYAYSDIGTIKPVITTISNGVKMKIKLDRVVGLRHEDGSGHSFIVRAYVFGKLKKFYLDTASRKGHY